MIHTPFLQTKPHQPRICRAERSEKVPFYRTSTAANTQELGSSPIPGHFLNLTNKKRRSLFRHLPHLKFHPLKNYAGYTHSPTFHPYTILISHNPEEFPDNNPARQIPRRPCPTKNHSWPRCSNTKHHYN